MYYNITPLQRLLTSAKKMGVKQAVVLGSYFSYFAKTWPHLKLVENHPYIASRIKQENIAFSYADDSFSVIVLELPYIFGIQEGRKPVWSIFVERFAKPHVIFFPKGGTAMVTTHQVGVAIYHALLYGINGKSYPLVSVNMPWKTMIRHALKAMDMNKSVITIPNWLAALGIKSMQKNYTKKGIEPGLNPKTFSKLMTAYTYIDPNLCADLRLPDDDIVKAIHASMSYAYQIMNQKAEVVDMKDAL
jgi:nucleoside-diphosphate-sugar epimerase